MTLNKSWPVTAVLISSFFLSVVYFCIFVGSIEVYFWTKSVHDKYPNNHGSVIYSGFGGGQRQRRLIALCSCHPRREYQDSITVASVICGCDSITRTDYIERKKCITENPSPITYPPIPPRPITFPPPLHYRDRKKGKRPNVKNCTPSSFFAHKSPNQTNPTYDWSFGLLPWKPCNLIYEH